MKLCNHKMQGYTNLKKGMKVKVYLENDNGEFVFEGVAILKQKMGDQGEPFPVVEKCPLCKRTVNNIKERWLVVFPMTSIFDRGYTTVRDIHRFHSYGTPHIRDEYDKDD